MSEGAALLARYGPHLVVFPQDRTRSRPGARSAGANGWGDYHPCSAEFFLARAQQRYEPPAYNFGGVFRKWQPLPRTGLTQFQQKLASVRPEQTARWELDVADIPSQSEERAWRTYFDMLDETADPYACVVYGRFVDGAKPALQYWYLYIYNDFRNNHEADWEMATIELRPDDKQPVRMGLSSHHTGSQRPWRDVQKIDERPVIYVARGSHANYFRYDRRGFPAIQLHRGSSAPFPLAPIVWVLQRLPGLCRWRDQSPADPERDADARPEHIGVRIDPTLRILTDDSDPSPDPPWWLRYWGKWGSSHPRLAGTVGVDSPWASGGADRRWRDPAGWIDTCREDAP